MLQAGDVFVGETAGGSECDLTQSRRLTQRPESLAGVLGVLPPCREHAADGGAGLGCQQIIQAQAVADATPTRVPAHGEESSPNPVADGVDRDARAPRRLG